MPNDSTAGRTGNGLDRLITDRPSLPRIAVVATGGTIAGYSSDPAATVGYTAGALDVSELLDSIPEARKMADIVTEQPFSPCSENRTMNERFVLAKTIRRFAANPEIAGIVVTHGTDTMEETAYFLNLTLGTDKPVVLTGAMRPATAIGADGPANLMNAIATAISPDAAGRGVMVVMNDTIVPARSVTKGHTTRVDAFQAIGQSIGVLANGRPEFLLTPTKRHTTMSEFTELDESIGIPQVDIVSCYAEMSEAILETCLSCSDAVVLSAVGDGAFPRKLHPLVHALAGKMPVVRSTRVADGPVVRNGELNDDEYGTIAGNSLNPQKARVLLTLCLMKKMNTCDIIRCFGEY
ncbi:MAG: asparaginase [Victivallaceae bacterium]|nr:asparaginase [Victivallaceae bacterium]